MVKFISIQAKTNNDLSSAEDEIKSILKERHNIIRNKDDDFTVRDFTYMMETIR